MTAMGEVHTFCHAVRDKWHVMRPSGAGGHFSLQNGCAINSAMLKRFMTRLMHEAATAPAGSQGLFWLPYLMGERTPHLDAQARGGWIGLTARHTRADLIRAVIEGVSYSQKDALDIIEQLGSRCLPCEPRRRRAQSVLASGSSRRSRQKSSQVSSKRK